jgi:hypothetical protein
VIAFAYVALTIIVALAIPLTFTTPEDRSTAG